MAFSIDRILGESSTKVSEAFPTPSQVYESLFTSPQNSLSQASTRDYFKSQHIAAGSQPLSSAFLPTAHPAAAAGLLLAHQQTMQQAALGQQLHNQAAAGLISPTNSWKVDPTTELLYHNLYVDSLLQGKRSIDQIHIYYSLISWWKRMIVNPSYHVRVVGYLTIDLRHNS